MKTRFFVSDINEEILRKNIKNKKVFDIFGKYFLEENEANSFIKEYPFNTKYQIVTEGRLSILSLTKIYE